MEAEVEAIFENHVEAKVEALMRKKNESGSRGDFEKNRAEAKENFSFLEAEAEALTFFLKSGSKSGGY